MIDPRDVTGLVLAGGQGSRMGGVDKGLQPFDGQPLVRRALELLTPQVGSVAISANRHLDRYRSTGAPVWSDDSLPGYAGPLAGFLAGLERCTTPWLVTVPCDAPCFPADLVQRLAAGLEDAEIAVAATLESGVRRAQPTFCLMRTVVLAGLQRYTAAGGRKIDAWASSQRRVDVLFNDLAAFANANTLDELQRLQGRPTTG